jgi:hypothetical protein
MKQLLIIGMLVFFSCKATKNTGVEIKEPLVSSTVNCPENGECTIAFIPNKAIEFKKDEFGIGYPVISEGTKTIFKFTYKKKPISNTQDSNYTEIVYAELSNTITETHIEDSELETIKLYFGRLCYCKGETGYYPIKTGKFKLQQVANNVLKIAVEFRIKEVPQIISKISELVSIKSTATN